MNSPPPFMHSPLASQPNLPIIVMHWLRVRCTMVQLLSYQTVFKWAQWIISMLQMGTFLHISRNCTRTMPLPFFDKHCPTNHNQQTLNIDLIFPTPGKFPCSIVFLSSCRIGGAHFCATQLLAEEGTHAYAAIGQAQPLTIENPTK